MPTTILTPKHMTDWLKVLDQIDASISRALDETAEYERALTAAPVPSETLGSDKSTDDQVRGLRLHLDAAGRLAEAVEALLAADEGEVRAWTSLAARAKARLATSPQADIS
jgi:hypothetical protein